MITDEQMTKIKTELLNCWYGNPLQVLALDAMAHSACVMIVNMLNLEGLKQLHDAQADEGWDFYRMTLAWVSPTTLLSSVRLKELADQLVKANERIKSEPDVSVTAVRFGHDNGRIQMTMLTREKPQKGGTQ